MAPPQGVLRSAKELRRVAREIISLRAEVIVDDVEKHHQPARVCGIDQRLEIVGPAVDAVRRKQQNAVVTPVPASGKIRDRHQLDRGDPGRREVVELVDDAAEGAGLGERSDMQLAK